MIYIYHTHTYLPLCDYQLVREKKYYLTSASQFCQGHHK